MSDKIKSLKEWHKELLAIRADRDRAQWHLGDLVAYAESPVTGWGRTKYRMLVNATGCDQKELRRYARVARRFKPEFREYILSDDKKRRVSFECFYCVMPLDDNRALYLLRMVRDGGESLEWLRQEVKKCKKEKRVKA